MYTHKPEIEKPSSKWEKRGFKILKKRTTCYLAFLGKICLTPPDASKVMFEGNLIT